MQGETAPFSLGICFPLSEEELHKADGLEIADLSGTVEHSVKKLTVKNTLCYAFAEDLNMPEKYDAGMEQAFNTIIKDFQPDIIHVFGTEFPHAFAVVKAFKQPEKILIGIQGLCGEIAKVYMAGLPQKVQKQVTFRDFVKKDSLRQQQQKFIMRGENEALAIQGAGNITGRTEFDRLGTAKINANARYFAMNETMRSIFYTGKWNLESCEKHSIFLGQGDYPLKGMHFMLEAMAQLQKKYPDVKLYVAGNSITRHSTLKEKIKLSAYGKYLIKLMDRFELSDKVFVTGKLSAEEMKQQFLNSSLFVCTSVLENSPNTVGEAMLLGVPVVASGTGGIPDMITDRQDGMLFETGNVSALVNAIEILWEDAEGDGQLIKRISAEATMRAAKVHDGETNYKRLVEIYNSIYDNNRATAKCGEKQ